MRDIATYDPLAEVEEGRKVTRPATEGSRDKYPGHILEHVSASHGSML
jgi:hypothetical protein